MKRLITLLIIIGITLAAAMITPWLIKDPGYFYLRFAGYEIEMRFIVALGLFILAIFAFWLIVYFLRLPKNTMKNFSSNRSRKAFARGLLALSEGKWKQAEKLLLLSCKNSPTPELGFMAAARAAIAQNKLQQAFTYLNKAESCTDNPLTVDLTRCELWIKTGENTKAINLLKRILRSYPNNPRALYLMTQASQNAGDWQQLRAILPKVEKLEIITQEKVSQLTQQTISQQLKYADSELELQVIWNGLNKKQKLEDEYLHAYAQTGLKLGMSQQIAKLIETSLSKNFSPALLKIWSQLNIDNNQKMKTAEKWRKKNPDNAELLQLLGRICLDNKLWGKAHTYLQQSLELHASAETFKLLAKYFDAVGEHDNALEAYRQADGSGKQLVLSE